MPIEASMLRTAPYSKEKCQKCGARFPEFLRGMIQSSIRKFFGLAYCAVICHNCKRIIGWEKPSDHQEKR